MENNQDNTYSFLVDKGEVVAAPYSSPELPKFGGNPLIEALPLINTRKQAAKLMQRFPEYSDELRQKPPHLRTHEVMDVLHFFQPLPVHLRLEGMISRVIRDSYLSRNPMDPAYAGTLEERLQCFKNKQNVVTHFAPTAAGFSILGMSGIGKSTGLRRVLHLYPQIILHSRYKERNFTKAQVVWLKLECPKDGSTKGLCLNFFRAFDALLGTTYAIDFGHRWRNTDELMLSMANIAARHHLGVLGIDEIQNLNAAKSGGADEMLNFFVNLINTIGLPVILIGTYEAAHILGGSFRQARRGSGQGDLVWDWMEFDGDWRLFVETLWELQYVEQKCPLTNGLCRALHEVSYGVTDLAIRIYLAAQIRAIETGVEMITEGLLRSAYRDDFRLMSRIIEVLKSGDSEAIKKLGDACPPPKLLVSEQQDVSEDSADESIDNQENSLTGSTQDAIGDETQKAITPQSESLDAIQSFFSDAKGKRRRSRGKNGNVVAYEQDDLRGIVAHGALSNPPVNSYQSLLDAGVIKSSSEFL
jgi:hypothetical protein